MYAGAGVQICRLAPSLIPHLRVLRVPSYENSGSTKLTRPPNLTLTHILGDKSSQRGLRTTSRQKLFSGSPIFFTLCKEMINSLIVKSFFTKRPAMTARRMYKLPRQYHPFVRYRWPLCLSENISGSFLHKESGERKEGEGKGQV